MNRLIHRTWHPDQFVCTVSTSPRQRLRGTVTAVGIDPDRACLAWSVRTFDGLVLEVVGDYVAAERRLLTATLVQDDAEERYLNERQTRILARWGGTA